MLAPFIFDAKDKHPTFIFSVIRSRMLAPFISDAKDKHRHLFLASYGADHVCAVDFIMDFCYIMLREIHSERECSNMRKIGSKLLLFFFFFWGGGGVGAPYIRETLFRFTACCKFGSLPCIFGVSQHVTERFPFTVTNGLSVTVN